MVTIMPEAEVTRKREENDLVTNTNNIRFSNRILQLFIKTNIFKI